MSSTVTVLPSQPPAPGMRWTPIRGPQGEGVPARAGLPEEARKKIVKSAWKVLGRGVAPDAGPPHETGLVVGYVQSGKTLSFTTAIGLARDNRFPLVIVVAGTKTSLHTQSAERLTRDLAVDAGDGAREWRRLANPTLDDAQTIQKTIEDWSDPDLDDDERATLLITVLKQQDHLGRLTNVLAGLASKLANVPVLVIDDEADQAGLNAKVRKGEESTIYRCLRLLRAALPRHTYLLYTATPQAPLLININSALSPSFVHVLEPGDGYVGGAEFFAPGSPYVKAIPPGEVLDESNLPTEPPASLIEALRFFFVGLAATLAASGQGPKQRRSMMVHPSRMRLVHGTLRQWLVDAVENWRTIEALPKTDPDRQQLEQEFRQAWNEAHATAPGIVSFDAMMEKLRRALRRTQVIEFNTNGRPKTPEIQWRDADGWILIGGQALDRGFTVDSLTVTYMPRGVGMGNADAIQQRARFFGYKRKYLGLCRVYLEGSTISAFQNYVQHEEIMRAELERVEESGISLRDWTRQFVLSPALRPCRSSVISVGDDYVRGSGAGGWTQQREAKLTDDLRTANAEAFDRLMAELAFDWDDTYASRSEAQRHQVCRDVLLRRIAEFLADYNLPDARDTAALTALLVTIGAVLEDEPDATANVYRMRPDYVGGRREVDAGGFLPGNFLQGRTGDGREAYPGDGFFKAPDRISVQLHRFDLREGTGPNAPLVASNAPLLAIHVPRQLALPTLVQPQSSTAP
jgi:hypothetical protein